MTKIRNEKPLDDSAYELLVAEEELILHAQMLIQRVLNVQGISQKELADKMGVGESYVSQMLGLSPRNLTLRTIARVMNALGVKATLVLDDYVEAEIGDAGNDNANAVASRMASAQLSRVWAEIVELPARKRPRRRHRADAEAYAAFEPSVQDMEMNMEMALAA
jgi:transcriptional regulator with XRE-family HTH domain